MTFRSLPLEAYRAEIHLDEPFAVPLPAPESDDGRARMVDALLAHLQADGTAAAHGIHIGAIPSNDDKKRRLLKALLTVRGPDPLSEEFHEQMDHILQYEKSQRPITDAADLQRAAQAFPETRYPAANQAALWQGDIATLQIDAIVNAANDQMLGCFQPFHACIDNVIHSAAGPRLREDCASIMEIQGQPEGTGWAKITRGYNLPSKFVLHTVGPIIPPGQGQVTTQQEAQLANTYRACLDLASQLPAIRSLAFCCISTGVFGFPQEPAAQIALDTVATWLAEHDSAIELVVYNVYTDLDRKIYQQKLSI